MNLFKQIKLKLFPEIKKDFWYNGAVHMSDTNYTVFDENKDYIDCEVGLTIEFNEDNQTKIFKVTKVWKERPNSDWLYSSDSIQCNLKRIK